MLPLTVAVTTFAGRMNLGITYRQTGFTEARLQAVVAMLLEQLENPDGAARSSRPRQPAEAGEAPAPCSAAA
jgi:hypothetical protein